MTFAEQLRLDGDPRALSKVDEHAVQTREIARVKSHLAETILQFARERGTRRDFFIDELREYVVKRARTAPASPDRILRLLRRRGDLDYTVVSRSGALYRFTKVPMKEGVSV